MPTLPPPQTIQIPVAPTKGQAHPPRSERTYDAFEQESTSFGSALSAAGESLGAAAEEIQVDSDSEQRQVADPSDDIAADPEVVHESADNQPPDDEAELVDAEGAEIQSEPQIEPQFLASDAPNLTRSAQAPFKQSPGNAPIHGSVVTTEPQAQSSQQAEGLIQSAIGKPVVSTETPQESAAPATGDQPAVIQQGIAPAPSLQSTKDGSTPATEASIYAQSIQVESSVHSETAPDDQQQQPDQSRHHLPVSTSESAPLALSPESAAAQSLRQASVDPAPLTTEPAPVDSQLSNQVIDPKGARPIASQQASQSPSLGTVEPDQAFHSAVGRGLAAAVRQQGGTLTIKLDPPTLGKLTIKMTIDQGRVEATFDAHTAQARDLLIEHASTLRAQLRDRGLTVERLEIVGAASASKAGQPPTNTGNQAGTGGDQDSSQHDAAGEQSKGRSETGEDQPSTNDGATGDAAGIAGEPQTSPFEAQLRYSVSAVA